MNSFRTIHGFGEAEIIIEKSRFIGYVQPVNNEEEAMEFVNKIRKMHSAATHNVYAYVCGENDNIQRYSDDGEPSGTAGMPVLNVIKQEQLKNIVVVVTRYFGGIKLGTGGLARAYTKSAKIGIDSGIIVEKTCFFNICIEVDYTLLGKVENELVKNEYILLEKVFSENVKINVIVTEDKIKDLENMILNATSGKCEIEIGTSKWISIKDKKILYDVE